MGMTLTLTALPRVHEDDRRVFCSSEDVLDLTPALGAAPFG